MGFKFGVNLVVAMAGLGNIVNAGPDPPSDRLWTIPMPGNGIPGGKSFFRQHNMHLTPPPPPPLPLPSTALYPIKSQIIPYLITLHRPPTCCCSLTNPVLPPSTRPNPSSCRSLLQQFVSNANSMKLPLELSVTLFPPLPLPC